MKIIDVPQSGKCGLTVSFQSRNGLIRRAWVVPANPRTAAQLSIRSKLAQYAIGFRALTTMQQDAWNSAAALTNSRTRLGQSGPLTGLQLYVKLNCALAAFGMPALTAPTAPPQFGDLAVQNLVITNTGGVIAIKLTCPGEPGTNTAIRGSAPQHNSVRALPSVRILGVCPTPAAGSADITSLYTARYGTPSTGDRLFIQANIVQDGWESIPATFTAVVPEQS